MSLYTWELPPRRLVRNKAGMNLFFFQIVWKSSSNLLTDIYEFCFFLFILNKLKLILFE